jgi:hypothetical protein
MINKGNDFGFKLIYLISGYRTCLNPLEYNGKIRYNVISTFA